MRDDRTSDCIDTTLVELLLAIAEVAESDDEAFAVLERMLAAGRISFVDEQQAYTA